MEEQNSLCFTALVNYVQPEFEELKRRFPVYVDPDYRGIDYRGKRIEPIKRCKAVSRESREIVLEYVHLDRGASNDEVLAEMDRKDLRPALYEELLGFDEKYPDEQRKYPIAALGSERNVYGYRYIAYLWTDGNGRHLFLHSNERVWLGHYRFLAVRK